MYTEIVYYLNALLLVRSAQVLVSNQNKQLYQLRSNVRSA